jgi:hypothetical protein
MTQEKNTYMTQEMRTYMTQKKEDIQDKCNVCALFL